MQDKKFPKSAFVCWNYVINSVLGVRGVGIGLSRPVLGHVLPESMFARAAKYDFNIICILTASR